MFFFFYYREMRHVEWMSSALGGYKTRKREPADWSPVLWHTCTHSHSHLLKSLPAWTAAAWTHRHSHSHSLGRGVPDHSPHMEETYTRLHSPEESQHAVRERRMTKAGNTKRKPEPFSKQGKKGGKKSTWLVPCCLQKRLNCMVVSVLSCAIKIHYTSVKISQISTTSGDYT